MRNDLHGFVRCMRWLDQGRSLVLIEGAGWIAL